MPRFLVKSEGGKSGSIADATSAGQGMPSEIITSSRTASGPLSSDSVVMGESAVGRLSRKLKERRARNEAMRHEIAETRMRLSERTKQVQELEKTFTNFRLSASDWVQAAIENVDSKGKHARERLDSSRVKVDTHTRELMLLEKKVEEFKKRIKKRVQMMMKLKDSKYASLERKEVLLRKVFESYNESIVHWLELLEPVLIQNGLNLDMLPKIEDFLPSLNDEASKRSASKAKSSCANSNYSSISPCCDPPSMTANTVLQNYNSKNKSKVATASPKLPSTTDLDLNNIEALFDKCVSAASKSVESRDTSCHYTPNKKLKFTDVHQDDHNGMMVTPSISTSNRKLLASEKAAIDNLYHEEVYKNSIGKLEVNHYDVVPLDY